MWVNLATQGGQDGLIGAEKLGSHDDECGPTIDDGWRRGTDDSITDCHGDVG